MTACAPILVGGLWPNEAISGSLALWPTGSLVATADYPNIGTYSTANNLAALFFVQFSTFQYMYPLVPPPTFTGFTATFGGIPAQVIFEPQNPADPNFYPPDYGGYRWIGIAAVCCPIPNGTVLSNTNFVLTIQGTQLYEGQVYGDFVAGAVNYVDPGTNISSGVRTNTSALSPSKWSMTLPGMAVPANDMVVTAYNLGSAISNYSGVSVTPAGYTLEGYHATGNSDGLIAWKVLSVPQAGSMVWADSTGNSTIPDQSASAIAFYLAASGSIVTTHRRVMQFLE